jgi:hypothetical protein
MHQFQTPDPDRMTDAEAQEVMRVLAERTRRREEALGWPSVHDVAALSNASADDVREALSDVRARSLAAMYSGIGETSSPRKNSVPWTVGACLALLVLGMIFLATFRATAVRQDAVIASPTPMAVTVGTGSTADSAATTGFAVPNPPKMAEAPMGTATANSSH